MMILAIDTCCGSCSVAIMQGNHVIAHVIESRENKQAELLVPMIERALNEAGIDYNALSAVAVTIGPGSFTGIRAGLAVAYGIATMMEIVCIGVSTLETSAYQLHIQKPEYYISIAAGRERYYVQKFNINYKALGDIELLNKDEAAKLYDLYQNSYIDATVLGEIAQHRIAKVGELPTPIYTV